MTIQEGKTVKKSPPHQSEQRSPHYGEVDNKSTEQSKAQQLQQHFMAGPSHHSTQWTWEDKVQKDGDSSLVRSMTYRTHEHHSSWSRNGIQREKEGKAAGRDDENAWKPGKRITCRFSNHHIRQRQQQLERTWRKMQPRARTKDWKETTLPGDQTLIRGVLK